MVRDEGYDKRNPLGGVFTAQNCSRGMDCRSPHVRSGIAEASPKGSVAVHSAPTRTAAISSTAPLRCIQPPGRRFLRSGASANAVTRFHWVSITVLI